MKSNRQRVADMRIFTLMAMVLVAGTATALAADIENFSVKTGADLLALCDADPSSDKYVAAMHFCQGFGVGAWQYYKAVIAEHPESAFVCVPQPPPTRNEALAAFVAWMKANPQYLNSKPVDALFQFLAETYPCSR